MLDKLEKLFRPVEILLNANYDNNYLFYALLGSFVLFIALIIYLILAAFGVV